MKNKNNFFENGVLCVLCVLFGFHKHLQARHLQDSKTLSFSVDGREIGFLILKKQKGRKNTTRGGGIIPTALIVKANKKSPQDGSAL